MGPVEFIRIYFIRSLEVSADNYAVYKASDEREEAEDQENDSQDPEMINKYI